MTAKFHHDKESALKGYYVMPDGERMHCVFNGPWHFMEGEEVVGDIVVYRHMIPQGDNLVEHVQREFMVDCETYKLPDFYYDHFEKRRCVIDGGFDEGGIYRPKVRGSFISDCKICGAKRVNEIEHARLSGCFQSEKALELVRLHSEEKRAYYNDILGRAAERSKQRQQQLKKKGE